MRMFRHAHATALVALLLAVFGCTPTAGRQKSENQSNNPKEKETKTMKPIELTKEEFKKNVYDYTKHPNEWSFEGSRPAVIDFYATWCGPCRATAPAVEAIAQKYEGKVDVYKVDVDKQEELAALFGIQTIATLLFIPKNELPTKKVGAMTEQMLDENVKQLLLQ